MARYARAIRMAVEDTKPDVVAHILQQETRTILVGTDVDSIYFYMYDLVTKAQHTGFPKVAAWSDQAGGIALYEWATDGSETDNASRYIIWFRLYWAAAQAEPQSTWAAELTIANPWEY